MKQKTKAVIIFIISLFLIFLGASIIGDVLNLILKDKINDTLFTIIHLALVFIFVILFWRTKIWRYSEKHLKWT